MRATRDLDAAFAVIAEYDPGTYARMCVSRWEVSTSTQVLAGLTPLQDFALTHAQRPFGATQSNLSPSSGIPGWPPETWVNLPMITRWADANHVPVKWFLADVLVHEFRHVPQDGGESADNERPAFAASTAFADRLPAQYGAPIAALSRRTQAAVLA